MTATRRKASPEAFREAPKRYPHRVTLDLTAEQYEALREEAHDGRTTITGLLRELVDGWQTTEAKKAQEPRKADGPGFEVTEKGSPPTLVRHANGHRIARRRPD